MEGIKKWLSENPLGALVARRLTAVAVGALLGVVATVGLVDPAAVAACQRALGL